MTEAQPEITAEHVRIAQKYIQDRIALGSILKYLTEDGKAELTENFARLAATGVLKADFEYEP